MSQIPNREPKHRYPLGSTTIALIVLAALWYTLVWWGNQKSGSDAVERYEAALRQGDRRSACLHAGAAAAAHLSSKNEEVYRKWRVIEARVCGR